MRLLTIILSAWTLLSPDGKIAVNVNADKLAGVSYSVSYEGAEILAPSPVSMTLGDGTVLGKGQKPGVKKATVDNVVKAVTYKKAEVRDNYNALTLKFKGHSVEFRAYDEGAAYRFCVDSKTPFKVKSEQAAFNFGEDVKAWISYVCQHTQTLESQLWNSYENTYVHENISKWNRERLAFLPTLFEKGGVKVCITESDLLGYPGMLLYNGDGDNSVEAVYAAVPDEVEQGGHNMLQGLVKTRRDFIAERPAGANTFPWRVIGISSEDRNLPASDLVWLLGKGDDGRDWSWLKPGKVAWDWWNAWNIYGVDFKSGINTETYKYYIDFAAANGIEYVIMDEGWAVNLQADLMQVIPEIDMKGICDYANSKGVGIVLWAGYWAFNRDMDAVCRHYSEMGVKGWKIDFMDRDDQPMVEFYEKAAATAAKYRQFVDFHGAFKPAGLNRSWPNVLNFEGVHGLEQMKWEKPEKAVRQVEYDVTIPFIRMYAGPMDYTQGAMRNATIKNYRPVYSEAMSLGTRCRQLAEYVIFDAPFTMLCDSPSNYMAEPECTKFISRVPTVWDRTVPLDGKVGDYVALAREKDGVWYAGALTDESARELTLDLSFLPAGSYSVTVFRDGVNADKAARDYKKETFTVASGEKLTVRMAPAGGWVAEFRKL